MTSTQTPLVLVENNITINCKPHEKTHDNPQLTVKTPLLMPSHIQVHRQVPLNNANISEKN